MIHQYDMPRDFGQAVMSADNDRKRLFGISSAKSWNDLWQIECVLNHLNPKVIVELGTGMGAHTLYMGLWAALTGAKVYSFECEWMARPEIQGLPVAFRREDIRDSRVADYITTLLQSHCRVLLYCDILPWDAETFAPRLKAGDMCVVHDYELKGYAAVTDALIGSGVLTPVAPDEWRKTGNHMGFVRL